MQFNIFFRKTFLVATIFCCVSFTAQAQEPTWITTVNLSAGATQTDLQNAINNAVNNTPTTIYLPNSITTASTVTVPANKIVRIMSVGSTIFQINANNGNYSVITVAASGTLWLENIKITGANKTGDGGGVYVNNGGTFGMKDGVEVSENTASLHGGGVYSNGTVIATGGSISNNTISAQFAKGGGVYMANGTFDATNLTIANNTVTVTGLNVINVDCMGGGVFIKKGTFNAIGCTIDNNAAKNETTGSGGSGAYNVARNSAKGGGIYVDTNATLTASQRTVFTNNKVIGTYNSYGAGIYNAGTLNATDCEIKNDTIKTVGMYSSYTGNNYGAGIHNAGSGTSLTDNCVISKNVNGSGSFGGGISNAGAFTATNCEISYNELGNSGVGAGIYHTGSHGFAATACDIIHNNAILNGGGIYCERWGTVYLMATRCKINNNNTAGDGGGVYGGITAYNCEIKNNYASVGGGVSGNITAYDTDISGNRAGGDGGGIHLYQQEAILTRCTISNNHSETVYSWGGGGICVYSAWTIADNCIISGNTALSYWGGGVLLLRGGHLTATNTVISNNTSLYGGGVYLSGDGLNFGDDDHNEFTANNCEISGNIATYDGGGVCIDNFQKAFPPYSPTYSTFEATNGTVISGNTANRNGGAVYNKGIFTATDCIIGGMNPTDANKAINGGGVYNYQTVTITNTSPTEFFTPEFTMNNSLVKGNSATTNGGGIYNAGILRVSNTSSITNNTATADGGGIFTIDYDYSAPIADTLKYANLTIAPTATVSGNTAATSFLPPVNAMDFTNRSTMPFNGSLLTNNQINYKGTPIDTVCFTDSVTLAATVIDGGENPTYQWFRNGVAVDDSNDSIFKYKAVAGHKDTILCKVYPDIECPEDAYSQIMIVEMLDSLALEQPDNDEVCVGEMVKKITFDGTYNYVKWEVTTGNGIAIGIPANSGTGDISSFTTTYSGIVTITATPVSGKCEGVSKTFTITVNPKQKPKATIKVR